MEALVIGAIALIIALLAFIILNLRAFSLTRRLEGQNTCIILKAKRNLEKVTLVAGVNGEDMAFERRRVRKGQSVEFVFPSSEKKARVTVVLESGATQTAEA